MAEVYTVDLGRESDGVSVFVEELKSNRFNPNKTLTIVVAGRTGSGKSTLIVSLLRDVVSIPSQHELLRKYEGKIRDASVTVYETRGICFLDPSGGRLRCLFQELKQLQDIDLFIFCQEMFSRFDQPSLTALENFGSMLNENGWACCIVALTKANVLPITMKSVKDKEGKIRELIAEVKTEMQKYYFFPRGLCEISEKILFVPVGAITKQTDEREIPGRIDSIQDLTKECILRCKPRSVAVLVSDLPTQDKNRRSDVAPMLLILLRIIGIGAGVGALVGAAFGFAFQDIGTAPGAMFGVILGCGGALSALGVRSTFEAIKHGIRNRGRVHVASEVW